MHRRDERVSSKNFGQLKELCTHICSKLGEAEIKAITKNAYGELANCNPRDQSYDSMEEEDELSLKKNIEKHILLLRKEKEGEGRFNQLYRKLCRTEFTSLLKNRPSVLSFFLHLSERRCQLKNKEPTFVKRGIPNNLNNSTMSPSAWLPTLTSTSFKSTAESSSELSRASTNGDTFAPTNSSASRPTSFSNNIFLKRDSVALKSPSKPILVQHGRNVPSSFHKSTSHIDSLSLLSASPQYIKYKKTEVSESVVIKELLYCFQGIEGALLKSDHNLGFTIDHQVRVPQRPLVERLMDLGYLHNSIINHCKVLEKGGSVAQAIRTAIRQILTDYYGLIGSFHFQFMQSSKTSDDTPLCDDGSDESPLTLRRLFHVTRPQMRLLQTVCDAMTAIRGMQDGTATTALEILRHRGDIKYQEIITTLTLYAGKPIVNMIINWLVEGELFDPLGEFFIAINTQCQERDIWKDKFVLVKGNIPNVMSEKQAQMILRSGKTINFLNVICEKKIPITGSREKLFRMKDIGILDLCNPRSELCEVIAAIFEETSKQVMDILVNEFKLFQHFQGLRRYILLGQGDFVNYYMELVEPEMRKPAKHLQFHKLQSLKNLAERATLAHYEDPDILKRVSVKVLVASGGDFGSDVFGLQYLMHEPLDAALGISDGAYSHMFNFLWRTKRVEHILLKLRKDRWATKNLLNWLADRIPDINGVLVQADRLSHELLHFAREFHHYILFEVVECLWEKFSKDFTKAKSFDDIIESHEIFITELQNMTFQDNGSRTFINELRLIWDLIFDLEALEEKFIIVINEEYDLRVQREKYIDQYGTNHDLEAEISVLNRNFKSSLATLRAQYAILSRNYQDVLKKFLLELTSNKTFKRQHQLRLLSSRIDYNEYYKRIDARLTESMKYSRCSDLFN